MNFDSTVNLVNNSALWPNLSHKSITYWTHNSYFSRSIYLWTEHWAWIETCHFCNLFSSLCNMCALCSAETREQCTLQNSKVSRIYHNGCLIHLFNLRQWVLFQQNFHFAQSAVFLFISSYLIISKLKNITFFWKIRLEKKEKDNGKACKSHGKIEGLA